jgi:phenylacetate-CoA ligase
MNYFRLLRNLLQLEQNKNKSAEQLAALQNKKLRKLLRYAFKHSPYYRNAFMAAGITEKTIDTLPLTAFPVIDKERLMEHFDEVITAPRITQSALRSFDASGAGKEEVYLDQYHVVHSSGSTGTPRFFLYNDQSWEEMLAGIIRGGLWNVSMSQFVKWYVNDPRVMFIAATDGRYGGVMAVGDGISSLRVKQRSLDINTPLAQWVETVNAFRPNFIIGYPSAIRILAELAEANEVVLKVNMVFSCGEPLCRGLRSYLEQVFHAEVVNFYGASESLALGVELSAHSGMTLFDDLNVIEVIDGKMYLTCLYNYVQPLIRYQISDRLVLHDKGEANAGAFTVADVLLCRDEDTLWFENMDGKREFLHPLSIEGFCLQGLVDYQFRQTSKDSFEMLAEITDKNFGEQIESELKAQMKRILTENGLNYVTFSIRYVDQILPDQRTGKKQLIIRKTRRITNENPSNEPTV